MNGNTWKAGTGSHIQEILRVKRKTACQCNRINEVKGHSLMQINDARKIHIRIDLLNIEEMCNQLHGLPRVYLNLKASSKLNQLVSQLMTPAIIISKMREADGTFGCLSNHVCSYVF